MTAPGRVARDSTDSGGPGRPGGGPAQWWARLGRGQRAVALVVGLAVALNLGLVGARSILGGDPGGPVSSSFSTGDEGLEAYADLLEVEGRPVTRLRDPVTASALPAGATVVVADPDTLTAAEARRILRFTAAGGRLVLAGETSAPLLDALAGASVGWTERDAADRLDVWLSADGVGSARTLAGDGGGRWSRPGPFLALAGAGEEAAVVAGPVGQGRVIALADADLLHNRNLARADNAAFALALAGGPDRPVVFVESAHGFAGAGLDAVPPDWKWAAAGLVVVLVLGLWAAGARFGPAEARQRALRPPRLAHVQAVAADLDRVTASPADAAAPLAASTRAALAARLGVAADASPAVLFAGAEQAGLDPADVDLLVHPAPDAATALAVGALAASRQRAVHGIVTASNGTGTVGPDSPAGTVPTHPDHPGANP